MLDERGVAGVDGALADLGVSSMQLDADGRGFSFRRDEPLDMRMDQSQGPTAADLLRQTVDEEELANVIFSTAKSDISRRIARAIVDARRTDRDHHDRSARAAGAPRRAAPRLSAHRPGDADLSGAAHLGESRAGAARRRSWPNACARLLAGARLVVITFHSLEDRIVKHAFRALAQGRAALRVLTKRPIVPGDAEIDRNPRARSAKLRAIERLA